MIKNNKRLLKEKEENSVPSDSFYIQPLKGDLYKWHFTILGSKDTAYEGGLYHGYFVLPPDYPLSPPDIYYLNESGRYKINTKICLTITSYHKEAWTPAWTLRTMMEAVNAYFVLEDNGIGSIKENESVRREKAKKSRGYVCSHCGSLLDIEKKVLEARKKN